MEPLWCVVPAAGRGMRVGGEVPKQYMPLCGRPMIERTLERLAEHPLIAGLVVVLAVDDERGHGIEQTSAKPLLLAVTGGSERCDSVLAGLRALPPEVRAGDFVLVHDAARPCVRHVDITRLVERGSKGQGGLLGAPLRDTLKRAGMSCHSMGTEPRQGFWRAFTPQMFRRGPLADALQAAMDAGVAVTDEAMAMERAGVSPLLVEGAEDNLKVTTASDFALAEFLLGRTA